MREPKFEINDKVEISLFCGYLIGYVHDIVISDNEIHYIVYLGNNLILDVSDSKVIKKLYSS